MAFVAFNLGPALEKASLDTKIWILDHNYNLWGRVADELSNPLIAKYVDGVAWHSYVGSPDAMTVSMRCFQTSTCISPKGELRAICTSHPPTPRSRRSGTTIPTTKRTGPSGPALLPVCFATGPHTHVVWNLVLDEDGRPDITTPPRPLGMIKGLVTLDSKTKLTYSGNYHAFPHYSKVMQRGARVFASSGDLSGVDHVAAENPDKTRVLVLTNSNNNEQRVDCRLGDRILRVALPPDSITSLVW